MARAMSTGWLFTGRAPSTRAWPPALARALRRCTAMPSTRSRRRWRRTSGRLRDVLDDERRPPHRDSPSRRSSRWSTRSAQALAAARRRTGLAGRPQRRRVRRRGPRRGLRASTTRADWSSPAAGSCRSCPPAAACSPCVACGEVADVAGLGLDIAAVNGAARGRCYRALRGDRRRRTDAATGPGSPRDSSPSRTRSTPADGAGGRRVRLGRRAVLLRTALRSRSSQHCMAGCSASTSRWTPPTGPSTSARPCCSPTRQPKRSTPSRRTWSRSGQAHSRPDDHPRTRAAPHPHCAVGYRDRRNRRRALPRRPEPELERAVPQRSPDASPPVRLPVFHRQPLLDHRTGRHLNPGHVHDHPEGLHHGQPHRTLP